MRVTVARRYRFEAEHHLPDFDAPWNEPHTHLYTVEVVADSGIGVTLVDTDHVDRAWKAIEPVAGSDLNERYAQTTVEVLAALWLVELRAAVWQVREVSVWEDESRCGRASVE